MNQSANAYVRLSTGRANLIIWSTVLWGRVSLKTILPSSGDRERLGNCWHSDRKGRSPLHLAFHANVAVHTLTKSAAEGQPQSRSPIRFGGQRIGLIELGKESVDCRGGNANTGVLH